MIDLLHISLFEKIINYLDDYRDIHSLKISNKNIYHLNIEKYAPTGRKIDYISKVEIFEFYPNLA